MAAISSGLKRACLEKKSGFFRRPVLIFFPFFLRVSVVRSSTSSSPFVRSPASSPLTRSKLFQIDASVSLQSRRDACAHFVARFSPGEKRENKAEKRRKREGTRLLRDGQHSPSLAPSSFRPLRSPKTRGDSSLSSLSALFPSKFHSLSLSLVTHLVFRKHRRLYSDRVSKERRRNALAVFLFFFSEGVKEKAQKKKGKREGFCSTSHFRLDWIFFFQSLRFRASSLFPPAFFHLFRLF